MEVHARAPVVKEFVPLLKFPDDVTAAHARAPAVIECVPHETLPATLSFFEASIAPIPTFPPETPR
jgi:hypothetical protein